MISLKVLFRAVVLPYFKSNVSFFFLIFVVMFACVHPPELIVTYSFISAIASSYVFLLIYFFVVALYARKSYRFFLRCIEDNRNIFFYYLPLLGFTRFTVYVGATILMLLSPLIIYGLLIIIVAISTKEWLTLLFIFVFFSGISGLVTYLIYNKVSARLKDYKSTWRISYGGSTRFYFAFYINYLLNDKKVFFLLTKISSLLLLFGIINLFFTDQYPIRLIYFGLLVSIFFNNFLIYELNKFEDRYLSLLRNIPIRSTVYFVNAITYLIIMLPEWITLSRYFNAVGEIALHLFFMISVCLCINVIAYTATGSMGKFFKRTITLFLVLFIALVFGVPLIVVTISCFISSFYLFYRSYFRIDNGIFSKNKNDVAETIS